MFDVSWQQESAKQLAVRAPLQRLLWSVAKQAQVNVWVHRHDLLHPYVSGNKLYKLYPVLQRATAQQQAIVSFGGAYSNHLHALAYAGSILGIPTVGIVRGERRSAPSPTLIDVERWGMALRFVSRLDYQDKTAALVAAGPLPSSYLLVQEGGSSAEATHSCQAMGLSLEQAWLENNANTGEQPQKTIAAVWCSVGTGASLSGLITSGVTTDTVVGVPALQDRNGEYAQLHSAIQEFCRPYANKGLLPWRLRESHQGRYGRLSDELLAFMQSFELETGVVLDPIYTARTFWALAQALQAGEYQPGDQVVVMHTGGLQGRRGFSDLCIGPKSIGG